MTEVANGEEIEVDPRRVNRITVRLNRPRLSTLEVPSTVDPLAPITVRFAVQDRQGVVDGVKLEVLDRDRDPVWWTTAWRSAEAAAEHGAEVERGVAEEDDAWGDATHEVTWDGRVAPRAPGGAGHPSCFLTLERGPYAVVGTPVLRGGGSGAPREEGFDTAFGGQARFGVEVQAPFTRSAIDANPAMWWDLGARWLRMNFMHGPYEGPWAGPRDAVERRDVVGPEVGEHASRTWAECYHRILDALPAGTPVIGLLNMELIGSGERWVRERRVHLDEQQLRSAELTPAVAAYLEAYVDACVATIREFAGKVAAWEVVNEPNDIKGVPGSASVHIAWYARIIYDVYRRVKEEGLPGTILAGPFFSAAFDLYTVQYGDDYLEATFAEWDAIIDAEGPASPESRYPLDGLAYHVYRLQGDVVDCPHEGACECFGTGRLNVPDPFHVRAVFRGHIARMTAVLDRRVPERRLDVYLTEAGFYSNADREHGARFDNQADMLEAMFRALAEEERVAVAIAYATKKLDDGDYGLTYYSQSDVAFRMASGETFAKKPAFGRLQAVFRALATHGASQ